ncbi:hypothetical protein GGE67_004119 [Rhizobium leucaenae]|uniref:Uncharacterized protein n=1 Tax=Rhizobium leucaenae TaxID=29450 RepID=A0A7W7EM17_9HYPH|nr:hypothetical protein [Rhizobium leucaenae]MBB6303487.1 hypothetical protein [Rhizobium leucaenae]
MASRPSRRRPVGGSAAVSSERCCLERNNKIRPWRRGRIFVWEDLRLVWSTTGISLSSFILLASFGAHTRPRPSRVALLPPQVRANLSHPTASYPLLCGALQQVVKPAPPYPEAGAKRPSKDGAAPLATNTPTPLKHFLKYFQNPPQTSDLRVYFNHAAMRSTASSISAFEPA